MIINELYLLNKLFVKSDKVTSLFEKKKEKKNTSKHFKLLTQI